MEKEFMKNVYGYKDIKEELRTIMGWYQNGQYAGDKRKLLPRGILFKGVPGAGKTHLMREYAKEFDYPIIVLKGNTNNAQEELVEAYARARKLGNAIVIIDELDRLIEDDPKLTRILQTQLDGFEESNTITLAAANECGTIPSALLREGRFDRKIRVDAANEEVLDMVKGFANDFGLNFSESDYELLSQEFTYEQPSVIKSTLSNAYLRYGQDCTYEQVLKTKDYLRTGFVSKSDVFDVPEYMAIHEAGHALYTYLACKQWKFLRVYFNGDGGITANKRECKLDTVDSRIECIKISLSGIAAEDVILGTHNVGIADDLDKADNFCYRLMNRTNINGISNPCNRENYYDLTKASEFSKRIYDKKANKYLRSCYKDVKKWMKKHKSQIIILSKSIKDKNGISRAEMLELMDKQ